MKLDTAEINSGDEASMEPAAKRPRIQDRKYDVRNQNVEEADSDEEVEDWELVMAVEMCAEADEYASVEEMISEVGVEATVHALEKGWERMSEQPNESNVTTAGEYRALREFEISAYKEECNCM